MSYRTSHVDTGTATRYSDTMENGYLHHLWTEVERPLLVRELVKCREGGAKSSLDFACGTGRITAVLAAVLDEVYGVDVSADMLEVARDRCPGVRFVNADITRDTTSPMPIVDVATAFRFFQNAEESLRVEALAALHRVIRPDGTLVMNIQWNSSSLSGLLYDCRNRMRGLGKTTTSAHEIVDLLEANGFRVASVTGYGAWPWLGKACDRSTARGVAGVERLVSLVPGTGSHLQQFLVVASRSS